MADGRRRPEQPDFGGAHQLARMRAQEPAAVDEVDEKAQLDERIMAQTTKRSGRSGQFATRSATSSGRVVETAHAGAAGAAARAAVQATQLLTTASSLQSILTQVDDAVRLAYEADRPMRLILEMRRGAAAITTEPLDPEVLPADIAAEQALLGVLLYDNGGFEQLGPALTAADFYEPFHQRLFAAMDETWRKGKLVEPILMAERFAKDPAFEELGGVRYLADLVDRAPPTKDVPALSARVRGLALRRRPPADDELEVALREARERGEARAAELLAGPDMLGADDFAKLIGATRETVRKKLKRREILGLQGAKRGVRYPAWQVTRDGGLLPGLPTLFELLGDSPWAVFRFLTQSSPAFGGDPPKDRLRGGKVAEVLDLAEGQARGDFG